MSQSKSLAETLFEDLLNETPDKTINAKDPLKFKNKSNSDDDKSLTNSPITLKASKTSVSDNDCDDYPLSDLILKNDVLMKKLKKCRVKLPKIGQKKLLQMLKKSIKKNSKKNKLNEKNINISDNRNLFATKKSFVRLARVDVDLNVSSTLTRKRKSSKSPNQTSSSKKRNSQTKLYVKLSTSKLNKISTPILPETKKSQNNKKPSETKKSLRSTKQSQQKKIDPKIFLKSHLQDRFGRQYFKCHVRVSKVRSLSNLNVADLEGELKKKEKKRLKKKIKGLNKSVSFVETVEVFGESDSDDDTAIELNQNVIEIDVALDEKNDGAGGDDGNLTIIDNNLKKHLLNNDEIKNGEVNENVSMNYNDLIEGTSNEKLLNSPGKIGRIRKSFSPLKNEEDQKSPRSKLLRKGDEKIVRQIILDDDEEDDDVDLAKKKDADESAKNDISILSQIVTKENKDSETAKNNDTEKNEKHKNITLLSDEYESLSSDDLNDFVDKQGDENLLESKTKKQDNELDYEVIKQTEIIDDEDDEYYMPKQKIQETETDDEHPDSIRNFIASMNEEINVSKDKRTPEIEHCNASEDNDMFKKVVASIDMLNSNITSQSSDQFDEELKCSEDEHIDLDATVTTPNESAQFTKFSFNSFLKSSLQSLKTKILPESLSPKPHLNLDNISTTITTTDITETTKKKIFTYNQEDNSNDDKIPEGILLDEIDDESSALLGDPVLGGREMSF